MPGYDTPGRADTVSDAVRAAWNAEIDSEFDRQYANYPDAVDLLRRNPADLPDGTMTPEVHWPGNPAEPRFCLNAAAAEKLSDWGVRGRHAFHNEYCEYAVVRRLDGSGRLRSKRFTVTTELTEYWITCAAVDPELLLVMATEVLGRTPEYRELYGEAGAAPQSLTPPERRALFERQCTRVHGQPLGDLNTTNALFMSHPINGLDDLIYIVAFGARPYAVEINGALRRASLHEIFRFGEATHLACRNADPGAAQGAYDTAVRAIDGRSARGRPLAFADPLGMYIGPFAGGDLSYGGAALPPEWIKRGRGQAAMIQRLEIGPPDDLDIFLDDIELQVGDADPVPLTSGYQLAARFEVGPHLWLGQDREFQPDWVLVPQNDELVVCSQAEVCSRTVGPEWAAYQAEQKPAPRGLMP